jgi:hypothetical protein
MAFLVTRNLKDKKKQEGKKIIIRRRIYDIVVWVHCNFTQKECN